MDIITIEVISAQFYSDILPKLLPFDLAEKHVALEKSYRKQLGLAHWKKRRAALAPEVDAVIQDLLTGDYTPNDARKILEHVHLEVLLFCFERVQSIQVLIEALKKAKIPPINYPGSIRDFWVDLFLVTVKIGW
jgi:hypothetical protein